MTIDNLITGVLPQVSEQAAAAERTIEQALPSLMAALEKHGLSPETARQQITAVLAKQAMADPATYDQIRAAAERVRPAPTTSYRERMGISDLSDSR